MKMNTKRKKSKGEKIVFGFVLAFFTLWAIALLYPVFWLLINSFKHYNQYYADITPILGSPFKFPTVWEWDNYLVGFSEVSIRTAFGYATLFDMLFNTIWYCCIRTTLPVFVPLMTAYAMAKYQFHGRNAIYNFVIISMIIPIFGTGGAAFTFYYDLGLYDNPLYVVYTSLGGFGGSFLIMYGYFKSISWTYAEAVYIDGGNDYTVFFKIMLPMALPIASTFAIMSFIGAWNDYNTMLLYLPDYPTLASAVFQLSNGNDSTAQTDPPVYFSILLMMSLPVVVLFAIFSDLIMNNLTLGGIKG